MAAESPIETHADLRALLARLPEPSAKNVTLRIRGAAERHLRAGHPWLFDQAIESQSHEGRAGDLAVIFDKKRKLLALGLYDPLSPIRVKVLHRGKPTPLDEGFFDARIGAALERRAPLLEGDTDGYRVLHGENDGLPGLVVDRYADTAVLKLYTAAWVPWLSKVLPPLVSRLAPSRLVLRLSRAVERDPELLAGLVEGQVLLGPPLPAGGVVTFRENGLRFEADPVHGQKTGFFLDQRDNRARVGERARGKEVLNVFSYSGGFSLYAARGGARRVVSLDQSRPALESAERNFALNDDDAGVRACRHEVLCDDAFAALARLGEAGERFDLIVIDPPSFARKADEVERALSSYARLVRLGLGVLRQDGELVLASCSSRVSAEAFRENAERAARQAGRPLHVEKETGHALDHPVGFPEGAYLKCLFTRA